MRIIDVPKPSAVHTHAPTVRNRLDFLTMVSEAHGKALASRPWIGGTVPCADDQCLAAHKGKEHAHYATPMRERVAHSATITIGGRIVR